MKEETSPSCVAMRDEAADRDAASDQQGLALRLFLATALVFLIVACACALRTGIWLDEFWSFSDSDPGMSFAKLVATRWLPNMHPPIMLGLYSIIRATGIDDIGLDRIVLNAPFLLLFIATTVLFTKIAYRNSIFYPVFGILTLSHFESIEFFVNFRTYFVLFCLTAAALQYLHFLQPSSDQQAARGSRTAAFFGRGAIALSICLHYLAGLLTSACYAMFFLGFLKHRQASKAKYLGICLAAAWTVMLLFAAVQLPRQAALTDIHLVHTTTAQALDIFGRTAFKVAISNLPATVLSLAYVLYLVSRRERPSEFAVLVLCGIALGAVVAIVLNAIYPVIVDRYLLPWQVMATAILADLVSRRHPSRGWLWAIFLAGMAMLALQPFRVVKPNWDAGLEAVQSAVRACPGTKVIVTSSWRFTPNRSSITARREGAVATAGQRWMAEKAGFAVEVADNDSPLLIRSDSACPVLVWIEHSAVISGYDAAMLLDRGGVALDRGLEATLVKTETGRILRIDRKNRGGAS